MLEDMFDDVYDDLNGEDTFSIPESNPGIPKGEPPKCKEDDELALRFSVVAPFLLFRKPVEVNPPVLLGIAPTDPYLSLINIGTESFLNE